jgi:hypothetical protein
MRPKLLPSRSCNTHALIFGSAARYPWKPASGYTPPDALQDAFETSRRVLASAFLKVC